MVPPNNSMWHHTKPPSIIKTVCTCIPLRNFISIAPPLNYLAPISLSIKLLNNFTPTLHMVSIFLHWSIPWTLPLLQLFCPKHKFNQRRHNHQMVPTFIPLSKSVTRYLFVTDRIWYGITHKIHNISLSTSTWLRITYHQFLQGVPSLAGPKYFIL